MINRNLGAFERLYWIFNQWSPNNVVAICELEGHLDVALLAPALERLQQRHPFLQVRVLADATGHAPRFVKRGTGSIPCQLRELGRGAVPAQLDALISAELNGFLDPQHGVARLVYAHWPTGSALVLTCLHIVADATSALLALRDLLTGYEALTTDPAPPAVVSLPARPAHAALLPSSQRGLRALPLVVRSQGAALSDQLRDKPLRLAPERAVPMAARHNGYLRALLPVAQIEPLKSACAREQVSLHGLLMATLALAIAEELRLRQRKRAVLNIGSPVSFRSELSPVIGAELGSYVCTLPVHIDVGRSSSVWNVARHVNAELAARRARAEHIAMLNMVEWVGPASRESSQATVQFAETHGPGNLCLSNIGAFEFPRHVAGIAVRDAHWTASLSVTGYFLCAVCTTPQGLHLDASFIEGSVSRKRAARVLGRMVAELARIAGAELAVPQVQVLSA